MLWGLCAFYYVAFCDFSGGKNPPFIYSFKPPKATFEQLSEMGFTATNNSWAVRSLVCLNKGQRRVPCYWPFHRSERHQLGKAVTMPPVTFPLCYEQHFTHHGAQLSSCNWRRDRSYIFGRTDLFFINTPFQRINSAPFYANSFFVLYLTKKRIK